MKLSSIYAWIKRHNLYPMFGGKTKRAVFRDGIIICLFTIVLYCIFGGKIKRMELLSVRLHGGIRHYYYPMFVLKIKRAVSREAFYVLFSPFVDWAVCYDTL